MSDALPCEPAGRDLWRPAAPVPGPVVEKPGIGDIFRFFATARRNLLAAFDQSAYRDPIVRRRSFGVDIWIVSEPEAVKRVLLDNAGNYPKSYQQNRRLRPMVGEGLLTSEGEAWRWQRRTAAAAFQHKRILAFAPAMTQAAEDMLARWDREALPERDLADETMRLTYDVLSRTVFGRDTPTDARRMGDAFGLYFDTVGRLDLAALLNLPEWVPTAGRLKARPALR